MTKVLPSNSFDDVSIALGLTPFNNKEIQAADVAHERVKRPTIS